MLTKWSPCIGLNLLPMTSHPPASLSDRAACPSPRDPLMFERAGPCSCGLLFKGSEYFPRDRVLPQEFFCPFKSTPHEVHVKLQTIPHPVFLVDLKEPVKSKSLQKQTGARKAEGREGTDSDQILAHHTADPFPSNSLTNL